MNKDDNIIDFHERVDTQQPARDELVDPENDAPITPDDDAENSTEADNYYLPDAIVSFRMRMYLIAGLFAVGAGAGAFVMKSFSPLFFLVGSAYFLIRAFMIVRRWNGGFIREVPVLCTAVKPSAVRDSASVSFRTVGDEDGSGQEYFRFSNLTKRSVDQFLEQHPYIIYFDVAEPHTLIGFTDI